MIFNKGPKMQSPHGYKEFPAKKNPRIFIIIAIIVVALVCAGESFYYEADRPHRIENPGSRMAKVLWVSTPPSF